MPYDFDIPQSRGFRIQAKDCTFKHQDAQNTSCVNDLFLYALFARIALSNDENIEFSTVYNPDTKTVELVIPDNQIEIFNQITGMQRGPKMKKYIDWLIGSRTLQVGSVINADANFTSASELTVWTGATHANLDDDKIVLMLPTDCLSVVGSQYRIDENYDPSNTLQISVIWLFESGSNTSFDLQTTVNIGEIGGNSVSTISEDTNVSTINLVSGDIRETPLISLNGIAAQDLLSIMIRRNYDNSPDLNTESVGIIGIRITT